MLFFDYMGLSSADLPVLSESDTEITWLSQNPCPTLQACIELGLDTQTICRAAYEKSTQVFLSHIDPQLRFLRSYQDIRPSAPVCREWIYRVDFEAMMRLAIAEARFARQEGNQGNGAVFMLGQRILFAAHDTSITDKDPSQHAELKVMRQAVQAAGDGNLCGGILFSTGEPCPMCTSLAVLANVTTLVYGVSAAETTRPGQTHIRVSAKKIIRSSPVMLEVIAGILKAECAALYR
jgi:tRNA(adenine34) deaminase